MDYKNLALQMVGFLGGVWLYTNYNPSKFGL
jgi:hypothetical protein